MTSTQIMMKVLLSSQSHLLIIFFKVLKKATPFRSFVRNYVTNAFLDSHLSYVDTLETPLVFFEDGSVILGADQNLENHFPLDIKIVLKANPPSSNNLFYDWVKRMSKVKRAQ